MIIKQKRKEPLKSNWFIFFLILSISIIITYCLYNNSLLTIRPIKIIKFSFLLYLLDIKFYFIIIIIIFNFGSVYQTLILYYALLISQSIHFIVNSIVIIYSNQYVFPIFLFVLFYIILGKLIFFKDDKIYYKKLYFLYLSSIFGILFLIENTLANVNHDFIFMNKIISGFLMSFSYYYLIFKVFNINHHNGLQLYNFVESINNNILVSILFIVIIAIIYIKIYNKSFVYLLYLFSIIIPLVGIKYEIKVIFRANKMNWKNYNFSLEEDEDNNNINNNINMNNLISKIKITKPIKWNNTSNLYHILRFIFLIFIIIIISYFSNKIENNKMRIAFFYFSSGIFIFILSKIFLRWFELINMTYFYLESDSINS